MKDIRKYDVSARVVKENLFELMENFIKLIEGICGIAFLFAFGVYASGDTKLFIGCLITVAITLIVAIVVAKLFAYKTDANISIYIGNNELELNYKGETFNVDLLQTKKNIVISNNGVTATFRYVNHNNDSYRIIVSSNDSEKLKALVTDII